jgi:hypothetical protein
LLRGSAQDDGVKQATAIAKAKEEADPCGMTARKAIARTTAKATATIHWIVAVACCEDGYSRGGVRVRG